MAAAHARLSSPRHGRVPLRRLPGPSWRVPARLRGRLARRRCAAEVGRDDALHLGIGRVELCCRTRRWTAAARARRVGQHACRSVSLMSTLASIDRPTRSGCSASFGRVERDAHRHALHHLDPVAGGVLRRQQRKGRAGASAQAVDRPWYSPCLPYTSACSSTGWPMRRLVQLAFLEVGVDPHLVERNHRHQRRAGVHALAQLHAALGDIAVDRRHQVGALQRPGRPRARGPRPRCTLGCCFDRRCRRSAIWLAASCSRAASTADLRRRHAAAGAGRAARSAWFNSSLPTAPLADQRLAAVHVVLQPGERRPGRAPDRLRAALTCACKRAVVGIQRAHLAHGLRQLRLGLLERHPGVGRVQRDQHLAGVHEVGVVGADGHARCRPSAA